MIQIVIAVVATVLTVGWFVLNHKYKDSFEEVIGSIDAEEYRYPELFFVGFGIMHLIRYDMSAGRPRKRIREIAEITGKKYAQYYFYVTKGAELTYAYLALTGMMILSMVADSALLAGLGILLAALAAMYMEQELDNKLSNRRDALQADFPQVLSKLALLVNSGMMMRDAWDKVAASGDGVLYGEMKITMQEFQNGVAEVEIYRNFAERCGLKDIRRFSSTMVQNLQKGNAELAFFLREMADEMWEEKKHLAKRKGEAASSKLMLPTACIFLGILIMIMVPAFVNM